MLFQGTRPVDYVNTHGTSTPVGDLAELGAIRRMWDSAGYRPKVGSTKSLSGHSLGAAGVQEAIYSLLMMDRGFLAESANIKDLCDEAEGLNVLRARYEGKVAYTLLRLAPPRTSRVMSNAFGFGGTNTRLFKTAQWVYYKFCNGHVQMYYNFCTDHVQTSPLSCRVASK